MSTARTTVIALTVSALAITLPSGCSDDAEQPQDLGTDQPVAADAGDAAPDAAPPDSVVDGEVEPDATPLSCDASLDLSPLGLESGYCVVYRFPMADVPIAFNIAGSGRLWTYFFEPEAGSYAGDVIVSDIDPAQGQPTGSSVAFSFSEPLTPKLFASGYLALSPSGHAAVGYTQSTTFDGTIRVGDEDAATPDVISNATGNFSAVYIDDTTLLVNGTGLGAAQEGQGVYVYQEGGSSPRRLIAELGVASGPLALGTNVLYAGGFFAGSGNGTYAFTLSEVQQAITGSTTLTALADGDLVSTDNLSTAAAVGDDLVLAALDSSYSFAGVKRLTVTVAGDAVSPGPVVDVVTPKSTAAVTHIDGWGDRIGLLLDAGQGPEIAVIQAR